MADHKVKYTKSLRRDDDLTYWAQCTCGQNSGWRTNRQLCEDWEVEHHKQVQRVLASLHRANPSLSQQRDYYRKCAEDSSLPRGERDQWRALADELDKRVNDATPMAGQDPLF